MDGNRHILNSGHYQRYIPMPFRNLHSCILMVMCSSSGKFPERITTGSVVAQNVEEFTDYYYSFMKPINRQFTYQPECLVEDFQKMEDLHALNAGILGGCDIDFFQKYCAEAFRYVEANLSNLSKMDANRFNVFFEQHLCYKNG